MIPKPAVSSIALAAILALGGIRSSEAGLVTYTQEAIASGSLGATVFSNALVTIQLVGNDNNVESQLSGTFLANKFGALTLTVAGVGTATFTDTAFVYRRSFDGPGQAGFSVTTGTILATINPVFATYDLVSNIGPISGNPAFRTDKTYGTSLGTLQFTSASQATFTTAAVPEPSSIALLGMGSVAGLVVKRRRQKALACQIA